MSKRFVLLAVCFAVSGSFVEAGPAHAQGTKQWTVSRYEELERGTVEGVAIRSDGQLKAGPATSQLFQTSGNYVWSLAADAASNAYAGLGGTAAGGAVVLHITADGNSEKIFEGKELAVQAVRALADGTLLVVTNPDGKVYWLRPGGRPASDVHDGRTTSPNGGLYEANVIFDPQKTAEKPKYIWDVVADGNRAFVATGAPAALYESDFGGSFTGYSATPAKLVFRTVDQHIRCLLLSPDRATLWAGTDGSGVVYRLATGSPKVQPGKPFAVYAAPKREITALAMDAFGNVYAAAVGAKPVAGAAMTPGLPPLPVTGAAAVTITFVQPASANAASANTLIPEGSEIYRIAPDGSPSKLLTLKDDVVYALAVDDGSLLAATGNRGRVYRVDIGRASDAADRYTDVAHLEAAQGMAFAAVPGGQIVGTSNSGKLFRLEDRPTAGATYTSEVFDAGTFSRWGRMEVLPEVTAGADVSAYEVYARSGNVESPLIGWSDWMPVGGHGEVTMPGGRFAQWKAILRSGGSVDSVSLNYLQNNLAPVVDEVVVQPGARVAAVTAQPQPQTVQVAFPSPTPAASFTPDANAQPLLAQKDRTGITVRWAAHDDNGDDLMFAVFYRGAGEKNWQPLKDKISDRYLSFDSALLPDGRYEMRVVASDAPSHPDAETLTGEHTSGDFVVDTTPPVPGTLIAALLATAAPGKLPAIHATFSAKDATSPIAHAEYSVDAGPWQYLEPVGRVSDSLEERYDFVAAVPTAAASPPAQDAREHVLAVRVYDRMDNVVAVKTVVR